MVASILIRNATLVHLGHQHHNKSIDVAISEGKIKQVGQELPGNFETIIEGQGLHISTGWTDLRCHLTDPGMEHRDSLASLQETAATGGFTTLVTLPNSVPPIADKSAVHYIINSAKNNLVNVLPTGQIGEKDSEDNLAELYDMYSSGAIAFTSGDEAISNGLLRKALLYTKAFGATIITHPSDKSLENGGVVNESSTTLHTGLKTNPAIAEYLSVKEQIEIAKYCDAKIHFTSISTKESIDLIRSAKKEGVKVSADVSIFNLCFTDNEVLGFDENFKLYPPLRTDSDRLALIEGVNDGTINAICSNHNPQSVEGKVMEFDYAEYGALSLQHVLPWYVKYLKDKISLERFVACITTGPNQLMSITQPVFEEGHEANLTVFSLDEKWSFDKETNTSFSRNSHEWNSKLQGKVLAVIANNKLKLNN